MSSYGLEEIAVDQCNELLRTQHIGRVGMSGARPGVFPVVYALLDGEIVFRTAPGEKLIAAATSAQVVFEIDAYDVAARTGWSVNVLGTAEEIELPDDLVRAEALNLDPWAGEVRNRYVRIRAVEVSGRRVAPSNGA